MEELRTEQLVEAGLGVEEAESFKWKVSFEIRAAGESPASIWKALSKKVLTSSHPFPVHQLLYYTVYKGWNASLRGPPPVWFPSLADAKKTNLGKMMDSYGRDFFGRSYSDPITNFRDLHSFSLKNPEVYWKTVLQELDIPFTSRPSCMLDVEKTEMDGEPTPGGQWLPGAILNAAESCLKPSPRRKPHNTAVVWRDEGNDDEPLRTLTLTELRLQVCKVANALEANGFSNGDAIAINMPMTPLAVAIYLGIVLSGCVVVSIADSFSASEIGSRLRISKAKAIFTQDVIVRGGKELPLYSRVVEAGAPSAIVIPGKSSSVSLLRNDDMQWDTFLAACSTIPSPEVYTPAAQPVEAFSNILFSSGTTGEPKAIPWTHATPIKAAADAWAHQDIQTGDVVAWPTNLGWMMGPWLVYAALVNGATIALYNGSPLGRGFAKFIQDAKVTMLGVVPSIVRHWRTTKCLDGFDLSRIRCFSSTGEASTVDDYLWLMSRAGYQPVIEYCGGTEIGGSFVTGSMLQPQALATFSTPAMGCDIIILDEAGLPLPSDAPGVGECALDPSILGASRILLNASHFKVYYNGMPKHNGKVLRRHGDEFERTPGGFYKAHGRVDDTMNLGGIKVSSVEIERVCNSADERVLETAAIGISPPGGGPEKLVIIVVPKVDVQLESDELRLELKRKFNSAMQRKLNPLFKVEGVELTSSLPRTASNKVMRRELRTVYRNLKSLL